MSQPAFHITVDTELDPQELADAAARREQFDRNWDWLEAHATEVYANRGKYICVSGQELFAGDSVGEVLKRACAAHPDDKGRVTRYIPKEKGARVYAH